MNTTPGEGEIKRKRLEFSISSEGSGDTVDSRGYYSEDSSADLLKIHRTPSCVSSITQCANQQKLEDLYRSYSKLKIYFCVLCVVNVIIILLVCVFFAVFFIRFSKNDQGFDNLFQKPPQVDDKPVQSKSQALSSNDHTLIKLPQLYKETEAKIKCSVLRYKLNVTQYEQKEMCSLEDMVDSISKFLRPREYNDVLHLTDGSPEKVGSLCFLKNWEKDKDNSSPEAGGLKFSKERGTIIIPSNGYYYVYSRLTFKRNPSISAIEAVLVQKQEIKHIIEKSRQISSRFSSVQSSSIHCTNSSFVHSSFVQRVVYLETGDELRVRMSDSGQIQFDEKYKRENFFGIFRL
uniref:Uncharacterized protein LOC111135426 n=1 Tax=Crassostrea virginica TaxID=6565 RepID=A0A8B8EMP7_CRAVI|nr:uncharacterized protein LOC111135426 [Crassostrea virginica]XP_022341191.1 uncharacterized protein LOC111135426 [Crassostrea virginica]XP_022341192.1 uncharacterized protein LOC111135426 [Crassostrea virginica]